MKHLDSFQTLHQHVSNSPTDRRTEGCHSACNIDPVLPHLRMLLSLDGYSSDCRPVRGCVIARRIGGTGGVAECPSHAAPPPVPGSPMTAGAVPPAMRGMITSAAFRLSDRN